MRRSGLYKSAVIVHALNSLFLVLATFPALMQGPRAHTITEGVPQFVLVTTAFIGAAGLVSAYGAWQGQQWGIVLSILVEVINGILALPGVLVAPSLFARIAAVISALIALFVVAALLARPKPAMQPIAQEPLAKE